MVNTEDTRPGVIARIIAYCANNPLLTILMVAALAGWGYYSLRSVPLDAIPDLSRFECRPASTEPVYRIMLEAKETPVPVLAQQATRLAHHIQTHFGRLGESIEILYCVNGGRISPSFSSGFRE